MAPISARTGLLLLVSQALIALAIIGATLDLYVDQDHVKLGWNRTQAVFLPLPYRASEMSNKSESSRLQPQMPQNESRLTNSINETAAAEIRKRISTNLTRCQAMQIVRPGIQEEEIVTHFVNESAHDHDLTLTRIADQNQSDCIPLRENCAIVGNSGILAGSKCGDVIDSAEYVIRFNLALLGKRFQEDVGSRTDVMTMNHEQMMTLTSCALPPKKRLRLSSRKRCNDMMTGMNIFKEEKRVLWFFKDCTFLDRVKEALGLLRKRNDLDFRYAYSPRSPMVAASRFLKVRIPSSGFAAYVAATQFCREISLFGFYPFDSTATGSVLTHYYDKKPPSTRRHRSTKKKSTNVHDMPLEYELLTELAGKGAIRLINDCNHGNENVTA